MTPEARKEYFRRYRAENADRIKARNKLRYQFRTQAERLRQNAHVTSRSNRIPETVAAEKARHAATPRARLMNRLHNARNRCNDPKNISYPRYGARGITFDFASVAAAADWIIASIGYPAPGQSLDRINNSLGYRPGNLRWATRTEQALNRDCSPSPLTDLLAPWLAGWHTAKATMSAAEFFERLRTNWPLDHAIAAPKGSPAWHDHAPIAGRTHATTGTRPNGTLSATSCSPATTADAGAAAPKRSRSTSTI